jgi:hypothetical protein
MDADDFWHPEFLSSTVPLLDGLPEVGLVHTSNTIVDERGELMFSPGVKIPVPNGYVGNQLSKLLFDNYYPPNGVLFRRECLATIGGSYPLDIPFAEDWNLWLSAGRRWKAYCLNRPLTYYRMHSRNIHRKLSREREKERCERLILDRFFADPLLPANLKLLRRRVLAARYWESAQVYFSERMLSESRRCVLLALRWEPSRILRPELWERLIASLTSERLYQGLRRLKWGLRARPSIESNAPVERQSETKRAS